MTWCWQFKHPLEPDLSSSLICLSLHTAYEMQCSQDFSSACGSCWQRLFQFIQVSWFILGNQSLSFGVKVIFFQFLDFPVQKVSWHSSCPFTKILLSLHMDDRGYSVIPSSGHLEFNITYLICPFESLRFSVLAVSNPSREFGWIYKPLRFILSNSFRQLMSQHS